MFFEWEERMLNPSKELLGGLDRGKYLREKTIRGSTVCKLLHYFASNLSILIGT